ncbi:DUF2231 domain-containing protein [Piscinibacter terrae]|uniref:DUF2231 domain-containing protein n=1 Tax=Piscinibacter terrae TaxID=2496871 RepID=A0A3N7HND8_9BURK|nr:DUF2231 domain-containing protein [Albitalea terrae]RQP23143.1 DUF2231 domain-containing protein [Albitalea terrae]
METPANIETHPIHPMLAAMPFGLWLMSLMCDVAHATGSPNSHWPVLALYTMAAGLAMALVVAGPGLVDMLLLKGGLHCTALIHAGINLMVVALYFVNLWLRTGDGDPGLTLLLSVLGIALLLVSGWLDGKMADVPEPAPVDKERHLRA